MPCRRRSGTPWRYSGRSAAVPGVELRLHRAILYNSIYRADDQLLVNQHAYGMPAAHAPVFHIMRTPGGEMAEAYLTSLERVWATGQPHLFSAEG